MSNPKALVSVVRKLEMILYVQTWSSDEYCNASTLRHRMLGDHWREHVLIIHLHFWRNFHFPATSNILITVDGDGKRRNIEEQGLLANLRSCVPRICMGNSRNFDHHAETFTDLLGNRLTRILYGWPFQVSKT